MEPLHLRRGLALSLSKGFTLTELLVVLAIIGTIMALVLTSQSSFNKTIILANTAYDIALTLRSVETFGLSSRGLVTATNIGYGLHVNSGSPETLTLFADTVPAAVCGMPDCKAGDRVYTSGSDLLVQTYTLGNGIIISDFCALSSSGRWSCSVANDASLTSLDISFARPNPDAFMSANGSYSAEFPVTKACLTISSRQGGSRFVSIGASGQITANAISCPTP